MKNNVLTGFISILMFVLGASGLAFAAVPPGATGDNAVQPQEVPKNVGTVINVRDPYKFFFNETWGDLPEEITNAKSNGKKAIMVFFEMDECPFCHYMKKNVLNQPKVQEYFRKHFLLFSIDIEGDVEMVNFKGKTVKQKDFAFKENRVRATPVIAFFDFKGKRIFRHTGKTSGVEEFMWMGEYIANNLNKKTSFTKYKKQKRAEAKAKK